MTATSPLTLARQAIVEAVKYWPETQGQFATIYEFEGNTPDLEGNEAPTNADLPALLIYPTSMPDNWKTNRMEKLDYFVALELWTPGWRYLVPEDLWPKIRRALWQGTGQGGSVPLVKSATNFYPNDGGRIDFKRKLIGDNGKAVQSIYTVHLWINDDPLGN